MPQSRRDFLKTASIAAISLAGGGGPLAGRLSAAGVLPAFDLYPHAGDPALKELSARALEAATAAGAAYADVRFSLTRREDITFYSSSYQITSDFELAGVGVRALVDGAWGFTSSTLWTADEMGRLGREAAAQARANAQGRFRRIELDAPPAPATGEWKMPIRRDPFDVTLAEKLEVAWAFIEHAHRYNLGVRLVNPSASMRTSWERRERTFASTDGAFTAQTTHALEPRYTVRVSTATGRGARTSDVLRPAAGGWELLADAPLVDEVPRLVEEAIMVAGAELIMPDRYDVVMDANVVAQLVGHTIGTAAELDRVLGYEANAGGTSYLAPPAEMLGKFALGPELLNVRANRSDPRGLATVRWDDEGVEPEEYDVVEGGVLVDYHTTRELAGEIGDWYARNGRPVRSHGCASSESALAVTMLHPPNVTMLPGPDPNTIDDMISGMKKGLVICGGKVTVDRQQLNGEINGELVYEVRNGKRTRFVHSSEALFRAPELWKSLQAIGGPGTEGWTGISVEKGQPEQGSRFGVGAVPALFAKVAVTDRKRKA